MAEVFVAGWVSCLDESMPIWTSRWTCPGCMIVPRKPHTMGNKYHSICCGLLEVMFAIDMVEGKDAPPERGRPKYYKNAKTGGLLLTGIIVLKKMGVYASALCKKRRYWPKYIKGGEINDNFGGEELEMTMQKPGMIDGMKFDAFAMTDPDYGMMLMSTYGCLLLKSGQKESEGDVENI